MELPIEIWESDEDRQLVSAALETFASVPLIVTDKLTNSVYLNPAAEEVCGERAEALVNRVMYSLLGFGKREHAPSGLAVALLGEAGPWRGVVEVPTATGWSRRVAEASAVVRNGRFVCGLVRLSPDEVRRDDG